jgi:hypothetical protein
MVGLPAEEYRELIAPPLKSHHLFRPRYLMPIPDAHSIGSGYGEKARRLFRYKLHCARRDADSVRKITSACSLVIANDLARRLTVRRLMICEPHSTYVQCRCNMAE